MSPFKTLNCISHLLLQPQPPFEGACSELGILYGRPASALSKRAGCAWAESGAGLHRPVGEGRVGALGLTVSATYTAVNERSELCAGELLIMRHTHEVRLVNAPAIVGESVLLNLLPEERHVRPVTLRAIAPCVLWVLTIKDLEHIFQVASFLLGIWMPTSRDSLT